MPNFTFALSAISVLFALSGCSSSDSGTTTTGSDSGTSGGGGLPPGVTAVSCYKAAKKVCDIHGESTQAGIDSQKANCTSSAGAVVDHCPTDGLKGCCIVSGLGSCEYDAADADALKGVCPMTGGSWTSPP